MAAIASNHISVPKASASDLSFREAAETRPEQLICAVVGQLRARTCGIAQILRPLLEMRDRNVQEAKPNEVLRTLYLNDQLLLEVLSRRYDEFDRAVRDSDFSFAEIDGEGLISYANAALSTLVPDAVGMNFAALFGPRAEDVRRAFTAGEKTSLRLDLSHSGQQPVQLRGELGPLVDEHGRRGAYALLLGVQAEERRLEASPDAVLRLDNRGVILFANRQAERLLGTSREDLMGRSAKTFFSPRGLEASSSEIIESWLSKEGYKEEVDALTQIGAPVPVRVSVMPWFDTVDRRSGAFLNIVPIAQDLAGAELERLLTQRLEPEVLVRRVLRAVCSIVPYDLATFNIFTERMRHQRTVVLEPLLERPWKTRWFPVDARSIEWLRAGQTWGDDLASTIKELAPTLEADPAVQAIAEMGLQSFLTLPIRAGGDKFRGTLTLLSKPERRYGAADLQRLCEMGVDEALSIAEGLLRRRQEKRLKALKDDLIQTSSAQQTAEILSSGISSCFDWDYAAVFRVDRQSNRFRLFEQHSAAQLPGLASDYQLPLDAGLLGATLVKGKPCIVRDAGAKPAEHGYLDAIPERASVMTAPLRIGGRIEWVVVAASQQRNAFEGPDLHAFEEVVAECQHILNEAWHEMLNASLLDAGDQAIVVVDAAGIVRRANSRALRLFGSERGAFLETALKSYGKSRQDQLRLSSAHSVNRAHITLRIANSVDVPVLAIQRHMKDDYNHRLWHFSDIREWDREHEWRYLEETVNEVAQNVRVPLLIAGSLIRSVVRDIQGSAPSDYQHVLDSALSYLRKADITYERLAGTLSAQKGPEQPSQPFNALQVLREEIDALPEEDFQYIELGDEPLRQRFDMLGWPESLAFAFRSLLGFLLQCRPIGGKIHIDAEGCPDRQLRLRFRAPGAEAPVSADLMPDRAATPDSDPIALAERLARSNANLAPRSVDAVLRQHGGTFGAADGPGGPEFQVTLPAAAEGS